MGEEFTFPRPRTRFTKPRLSRQEYKYCYVSYNKGRVIGIITSGLLRKVALTRRSVQTAWSRQARSKRLVNVVIALKRLYYSTCYSNEFPPTGGFRGLVMAGYPVWMTDPPFDRGQRSELIPYHVCWVYLDRPYG